MNKCYKGQLLLVIKNKALTININGLLFQKI